jgi:hypothetical protein
MNILSKLFKDESKPQIIPLHDLLNFIIFNPNYLIPKSDLKRLVRPPSPQSKIFPINPCIDRTYRIEYLLKNKYLIEADESYIDLEKKKYFGGFYFNIKIYLVDKTFNEDKYFESYEYKNNFPTIINLWSSGIGNTVMEGKWLDDLKSYMRSIDIKSKYLEHKALIDEEITLRHMKVQLSNRCKEARRKSILENYGKD